MWLRDAIQELGMDTHMSQAFSSSNKLNAERQN